MNFLENVPKPLISTFSSRATASTIDSKMLSIADDNSTVSVALSEAAYNTNGGSGSLQTSDFNLTISGGAATLASATPTSISKATPRQLIINNTELIKKKKS